MMFYLLKLRRDIEALAVQIGMSIKNDRRRIAAIEAHLGLLPPALVKE